MQIQLGLLLDRSRADTLTSQLVSQIRDAIRHGRIPAGVRLPSSRRLSEQLGVGRNTVTRAYETLLMEAVVEARPASGMYAAQIETPAEPTRAEPRVVAIVPARPATTAAIRGRLSIDFAPGVPNAGLFPLKTWRRHLQSCLSHGGALGLSQPIDPLGLASLRAAIAGHLAASRGLAADPDRIIVVGGVGEAQALVARLLLGPGALVAIGSPGPRLAADVFAASGAVLHEVAVDEFGLVPADLPSQPTALLHVMPSHHYPTGQTLAPGRREEIVAWARKRGCMIVEDDAGCAFRYEGGAPPAIAASAADLTFHVGSFAQAFGAGIGLAYLVVPPALLEAAQAAKTLNGASAPWLEQAALAEMMQGGGYAAHLTRKRIAYRERRDQLLMSLHRHFGDVEVSGTEGGMHLFWQLPPGVPEAMTISALSRRARVGVYPFALGGVFDAAPGALSRRGLILGYAALTPRQIEQGIARLSDAVDDALDLHRIGLGDLLTHRPATRPAAKPAPRSRQQPALPVRPAPRAPSRPTPAPGPSAAMPAVTALYRYPVKGLSAQPVDIVRLEPGAPFPFDRVFALARPGVGINPEEPKWAKKGLFVMLMLDEALARVRTHLDPASLVLTVQDGARTVLSADLGDAADRARVEEFFHGLVPTLRAPPRLVRARGGHFMDKPDSVVSLINLATLRNLEQKWGVTLDPLRFRANIYIEGAAPWAEFDWVGQDIRIGEAVFHVDRRNGRCGATNVDPATGARDLDIPRSLRASFGHKDLGVYVVARNAASLAVGDTLDLPGRSAPPQSAPVVAPHRALICRGCYYIFDEARSGRFGDLAASWACPDCGTDKAKFSPYVAR